MFRSLFVVLAILVPNILIAETHTVRVVDHEFIPRDLVINEGDTVNWVWEANFHNVVSGTPGAEDGVFESDIEFDGYSYQVVFTRQLLNNNPRSGNVYDYFCAPHAAMGMAGTVTVNRTETNFQANLTGWQEVPIVSTESTGACTGTLNDTHTSFDISCTHDVSNLIVSHIHLGSVGNYGSAICSLSIGPTVTGTCPMTASQVEDLFSANLYVNLHSTEYPFSEIRGQLVREGGSQTVTGTVTTPDGTPISGVDVSIGGGSVQTNAEGVFQFTNVENGVYRVDASLTGANFGAQPGVNPFVVNLRDVANRNIKQIANDLIIQADCDKDSDRDGGL